MIINLLNGHKVEVITNQEKEDNILLKVYYLSCVDFPDFSGRIYDI